MTAEPILHPRMGVAHTVAALEPVLRIGLAWLYDTEQPDTAIVTHHGTSLAGPPETNRDLAFVTSGWKGWPVLVLNVTHVIYPPPGSDEGAGNPLRDGEMAALAALLNQLGVPWQHEWNGDGYVTGSISLARMPHPSLRAALQRYRDQCPTHRTVFCGRDALSGDSRTCTWLRDGSRALVRPDPPVYYSLPPTATAQEGSTP